MHGKGNCHRSKPLISVHRPRVVRFWVLLLCLTAMSAAQDASQIVLRSLEVDRANTETARNYTFLQREQERLLDGSGRVKSKQSRTLDVTLLEGSPYRRLVARNDQ